jgi:hypothetical protein
MTTGPVARHGVSSYLGRESPMTTETYEILAIKYAERLDRVRA